MVTPERRRRPLLLVFGALLVGFVLLATLLPSSQGRRIATLERKLVVLERVRPPIPLQEAPIVARPETWYAPDQPLERRRYVRIHNFARIGAKLASAGGALMTYYVGEAKREELPSTSLHLAFAPDDPDALRLALVYAMGVKRKDDRITNLVRTDLGAGASIGDALKHKAIRETLARLEKGGEPSAMERHQLEEQLRSEASDPSGFAPGTRLFEVAGRVYRRRNPKDLTVSDPEIVEALADPKVKLP